MFEDATIPTDEIEDVTYESGIVTGHVQIHRIGVDPDAAGFLSHPVDENTLHFSRAGRECARRARDAILARASSG